MASQDRGSLLPVRLPSGSTPPPLLKVPTLIGWYFFACSPSENAFGLASVAPWAVRFPARFPQITLSVISRDASARDPTSSIFNDLQAAGSISNLVGRWGIGKRIGTVCQSSRWLSINDLRPQVALQHLVRANQSRFCPTPQRLVVRRTLSDLLGITSRRV